MKKIEAHIVLSRCPQNAKKLYGIRMERNGERWDLTWAFVIHENKAKSEGYDKTELNGVFTPTDNYNGCPYCGTKKFMHCPRCSKITCYHGEEYATCAWCGMTGRTQIQTKMSLKGGTM